MEELRSGLQSQCNFYQNPNGIFHKNSRKKKKNPKSHMQPQKTSNNQSESEQEQSWRYHTS